MAAFLEITITGVEELVRKCGSDLLGPPFRAAMTKSALDLELKAKSLTPRRTGNLQGSITHRIDSAPMPLWAEVGLLGGGPTSKTGQRYGVYVHEGTRPHEIRPRRARALYWPGARHPVRRVRHPGTRPNPFLFKALQQMQGAIAANFTAALKKVGSAWGSR